MRKNLILISFFQCFIFLLGANIYAQDDDSLKGKNIYKPQQGIVNDSVPVSVEEVQFKRDSIMARMQFVRDSILVREQFVRDSLMRRQRILDSLTFLQKELPVLLEAYFKTIKEDIIFRSQKINIIGDSVLGDYIYLTLPFGVTDPYTPWKGIYNLNGKKVRINRDKSGRKIVSIQTPQIKSSYLYPGNDNLLIIHEPAQIQNNSSGHFYKTPVDSIFYDRFKRIARIKRYVLFYSVVNNNQPGNLLFINRIQFKQYEYDAQNRMTKFQLIKYCDRWKAYESNKLCSMITYSLSEENDRILLTRRNDPSNIYSDGTFTFAFDNMDNLKSISFQNLSNTENWQRIIELNKDGNVNCYTDKIQDVIKRSLCMIYNKPGDKYPVETIITTFEKDGISYIQRNSTTGKMRTRDKMTLEWGPWQ